MRVPPTTLRVNTDQIPELTLDQALRFAQIQLKNDVILADDLVIQGHNYVLAAILLCPRSDSPM